MTRKPCSSRQRGFTMIEMIGVLAVIAILASIVAPKIFDAINESKVNAFASNIQAIQTAVASYYKDTGTLPTATGDLIASPTAVSASWNGPYLDKNVAEMFTSLKTDVGAVGTAISFTNSIPSTTNNFDIDGASPLTGDYSGKSTILEMNFPGMSVADARAVSGVIDGDQAKNATGVGQWWNMGRFVIDTYTTTVKPTRTAKYHAFIAAL
ncbi:MAG: type II secretion system protein GspG [Mariprofundales bacterium]|nr:type II secretion system protein GspG [Mariprofundales bacterium]